MKLWTQDMTTHCRAFDGKTPWIAFYLVNLQPADHTWPLALVHLTWGKYPPCEDGPGKGSRSPQCNVIAGGDSLWGRVCAKGGWCAVENRDLRVFTPHDVGRSRSVCRWEHLDGTAFQTACNLGLPLGSKPRGFPIFLFILSFVLMFLIIAWWHNYH